MQRSLRRLTEANAKSHVQGAAVSKLHAELFTKLRESVGKSAEVFRRDFLPAIEKISSEALGLKLVLGGVAGASAAAVTGASAMSFSFGSTAHRLRDLSASTGLAFNELRGLESLAPRIGVSVEALDSGFGSLNDHMERLRRNGPAEIAAMAATMFPNVRNQVAQLANLPREKQFEGILAIGEQIKQNKGRGGGIANEKWFLEFFGLPSNFADYSKRQIAEYYANYRRAHRDFTEAEQQAEIAADLAWADLRQRMQSFRDYVGANFAPALTTAMDGIGGLFKKFEGGVFSWVDRIKADPAIERSWDDLAGRLGADVKSIVGSFADFDDMSKRPRVLPEGVAPQWVGIGADIKNLITDTDNVVRIVDDLNAKKINWAEIMGLSDLDWRIEQFKKKWQPIVDWSDRMAKLNPFGSSPPVDPKNPEGPTGPSVLDRLRALLNPPAPPTAPAEPPAPLLHDRPPVVPPIPIPPTPVPPFVLPNLGGMDQFKSPSQNGVPPMPRPAFSPIAYNPADGVENPLHR